VRKVADVVKNCPILQGSIPTYGPRSLSPKRGTKKSALPKTGKDRGIFFANRSRKESGLARCNGLKTSGGTKKEGLDEDKACRAHPDWNIEEKKALEGNLGKTMNGSRTISQKDGRNDKCTTSFTRRGRDKWREGNGRKERAEGRRRNKKRGSKRK